MMATPQTTPWMPGRTSPSSALSTSASGTSVIAPMTGPHRLPTPVMTAILPAKILHGIPLSHFFGG
jgi:hypothetical protein